MPDIGVRELKTRASEIVRDMREHRASYVITYRGRPVGILAPIEDPPGIEGASGAGAAWDELNRLGEEIGRGWQSPLTGAELLSEMRR